MSKLNLSIAGYKIQSSSGFDFIPAGIYDAKIISCELKETKAKNGSYLEVGIMITSGEFAGKSVADYLNIVNISQEAQRIAMERLATYCWAIGHSAQVVAETSDLLEKSEFAIKTKEVEKTDDFGQIRKTSVVASVVCTRDISAPQISQPAEKVARKNPWE